MQLFDLTGRVAVITGGNGGIGLAMAQGMADCGAAIMVVGRNSEKNAAAVATLSDAGARAEALVCDLSDLEAAPGIVAEAESRFGGLDIVVNNAGMNIRKPPQDYTMAEWREVLTVNLDSAFALSQAAYPALCRRGGGKIVNIGSMMSIFGASFATPYATSKGGIVQMTKALACAWAPDNIQVNAVLPGWIDTELTRRAREDVKGLHERVLERTPAGRWGRPEDHAGIAAFLASAASDFVTGTAIPVDGGFSVQG